MRARAIVLSRREAAPVAASPATGLLMVAVAIAMLWVL